MNFLEYVKPDFEELELELEGSFLADTTGVGKDEDPWGGEFDD